MQALSGRAAIEAVKLALRIVDPDFEVDAVYYAARPGRMRIDITAGGKRVYVEAFNLIPYNTVEGAVAVAYDQIPTPVSAFRYRKAI